MTHRFRPALLLAFFSAASPLSFADDLDLAKQGEAARMATIQKVRPSVVAIFAGGGGGSGVLIDPEGYVLTNFHVVAGAGPTMRCGLPDGVLYDATLVGLDRVGDVALIKLMPKKEGTPFPFAALADSDTVKPGDWSIAMGNPFLLATDFSPTVTFGLVSGVNRYQYPDSGSFLEYTDCIQIDTSINPGNSGGPLFNMKGELIGINGRGSFDKRSRINSGVGYAISINQIKNFLGHLYAGMDTDHATLGARVETTDEDGDISRMIVKEILEDSDVFRRGLQEGDELVAFAGRPISTVNQYKNILGIFPKGWRLPLVFRHGNLKKETLVRLLGNMPQEKAGAKPEPKGRPQPKGPEKKEGPSPALKFYKQRDGFANYYFNELVQNQLLDALAKVTDVKSRAGTWKLEGGYAMDGRTGDMKLEIFDEADPKDAKQSRTIAKIGMNAEYALEPLKTGVSELDLMDPPNSGGLLMAMYQYRRFLTLGPKGFEGKNFSAGGHEPIYLMPADGSTPKNLLDVQVMASVVRTDHVAVPCKWYFYQSKLNPGKKLNYPEGAIMGFEVQISKDIDPCEVTLSDYRPIGPDMASNRQMPHRIEVRHAEKLYAVLTIKQYNLAEGAK